MRIPRPTSVRPSCESLEPRRLLNAGDLDPSFSGDGRAEISFPGSDFVVNDVAVEPNGKVVLAGYQGTDAAVVRLNADGTVDATFGGGGLVEIARLQQANGVVLQPDGRILVAGAVDNHFAVVRMLPGGSLDESFANHGVMRKSLGDWSEAFELAIQPDGNIVAVGERYAGLSGDYDFEVLRINTDGGLDAGFDLDGVATVGFGGDEEARAVAIDTRGTPATNPLYGSIVVGGGEFYFNDSHSNFNVARLTPSGAPDPDFDGDGKLSMSFPGVPMACATGVVIQPSGKVVVTGTVGPHGFLYGGDNDFGLARFLPSGDLDPTFGSGGSGRVVTDISPFAFEGSDRAFAAVADHLGGIAVGGVSEGKFALAVYTKDGAPDDRFGGNGIVLGGGVTIPAVARGGGWTGLAAAPGRRLVIAGGTGRVNRHFDVAPVVGLFSFDTVATEQGQQTAAFLVGLDQATPDPLRVYLSIGGTATAPSRLTRNPDYTYTGLTLEDPLASGRAYVDIPAGQTLASVVITPADDALAEGDETAVFNVRGDDLYDVGDRPQVTITIRDNEPASPVRVTQVFVNGAGITGQTSANGIAFRTLAGVDNTFGYPVPGGANQLKAIPWSNGINKISIRFDADVVSSLGQDDLVVRGINSATYAISGFSYDQAIKTGTWTLTNAIVNDKVNLFLDDALVSGLEGEWTTGQAYPSGNGTAGGDFSFRVNVLRGDANQDGQVSALDLGQLKVRLNRNATNNQGGGATGYNVFADLNADGQINALDLGIAKARLNSRLPTGEPTAT